MYRIGGRHGNIGVSQWGVTLGIPPLIYWFSNLRPWIGSGDTVRWAV